MKDINTTIRRIDKQTWMLFRKICVEEHVSANKKVKELIKDHVDKNHKNQYK